MAMPWLFGTFDTYPDPVLRTPGDADYARGYVFSSRVAEFVRTGSVNGWPGYAPGHIRHFG
jgi:hypothetical protein